MNRAERRRAERETAKSEKRYNLTQADIQKLKNDITEKACDTAINHVLVAFSLALHDEEGFGHVRLKRVLDKVDETMDCINNGYVEFEELRQIVKDECNIEFIKE